MSIVQNETLSPREHILLEHEKEEARLSREHSEHLKRLEIELKKTELELELELRKADLRWQQVFKIPLSIIKLPVLMLFGIAIIITSFTRRDIKVQAFWKYILDANYLH